MIYLSRMHIERFGAFSNRTEGPFKPGLNLVFGKNEAGKTTLSAFFGGVLFGWEEARGRRNTYRPAGAERSGSLVFVDEHTKEEFQVSRVRNTDGLQGASWLFDDIDRETYRVMFSLNSDELRDLKNTTDVTAKLLTAGSGTNTSPAHALSEINGRIEAIFSRSSSIPNSITNLTQRRDELHERISEAVAESDRYRREDEELNKLEIQRGELSESLQRLNKEIEVLSEAKASFEKSDKDLERSHAKREELEEERQKLLISSLTQADELDPQLVNISASEERALRDRIDTLAEEQHRAEQDVARARENYLDSQARYDAIEEEENADDAADRAQRQRIVQIVLSVLLPIPFLLFGISVLTHGFEIKGLSYIALGVTLIVFALILALAALRMLFRPNKAEESSKSRIQDARWVMKQDQKKLAACQNALTEQQASARHYLDEVGLAAAQGSLRRARSLLDEAAEERSAQTLFSQQLQAIESQLNQTNARIEEILQERSELCAQLGMAKNAKRADIEQLIGQKTQQRSGLQETSENVNRRYGELVKELEQAKQRKELDGLKLEHAQVATRLQESEQEFARLLLAKRMLEAAVSAWESKSQPEVYRQASELFSRMTSGAWTQVRMGEAGRIEVVNRVQEVRDPLYLSLGTCQQLYLSLRIALLLEADNVGRCVPILADDILINFDKERARGAAEALCQLAQHRQVILFTCHQEIVGLVREVDSGVNVLEL